MIGEANIVAERQILNAIEVQREAILTEMAHLRQAEVAAALPNSTASEMLEAAYQHVGERDPENVDAAGIAYRIMRQRLGYGRPVVVDDAEQLKRYTAWYDWTPGPQPLKHSFGVLALRCFPDYETADTKTFPA